MAKTDKKTDISIDIAVDTLVGFSVERENIKQLLASLPIKPGIDPVRVEYEITLLQILSIGWGISYFMEEADQKKLLEFVAKIKKPIKNVFVVQGERKPAEVLKKLIIEKLKTPAEVPKYEQVVEL